MFLSSIVFDGEIIFREFQYPMCKFPLKLLIVEKPFESRMIGDNYKSSKEILLEVVDGLVYS